MFEKRKKRKLDEKILGKAILFSRALGAELTPDSLEADSSFLQTVGLRSEQSMHIGVERYVKDKLAISETALRDKLLATIIESIFVDGYSEYLVLPKQVTRMVSTPGFIYSRTVQRDTVQDGFVYGEIGYVLKALADDPRDMLTWRYDLAANTNSLTINNETVVPSEEQIKSILANINAGLWQEGGTNGDLGL